MEMKGGEKLRARLQELAQKVECAGEVRIGFLEGATYPDGTSVAAVAAFNEFGVPAKGQPPRPFFRQMIAQKSDKWGDGLAEALKSTDYNAREALALAGEGIAGQLRQSITEFSGAPLAPSTVKAKGFSKALVDTGHMLQSVDFEVK